MTYTGIAYIWFSERIFTALEEIKAEQRLLKRLILRKSGSINESEPLPESTLPLTTLEGVFDLEKKMVEENDLKSQIVSSLYSSKQIAGIISLFYAPWTACFEVTIICNTKYSRIAWYCYTITVIIWYLPLFTCAVLPKCQKHFADVYFVNCR